jgi:hypothetical protein
MSRDTRRVVPNDGNGWKVQRDGSERPSHVVPTQQEAIDIARGVSVNQGTELQVHGRDGRIRQSDSHGRDPFTPKG